MKIHCDDVIGSGNREHVGNEFSRNRRSRLVLLVLSSIRECRNDGGDAARRGDLARVDHNQQLHQVIIDLSGGRLNNVHVFSTYRLSDFDVRLLVAELLQRRLRHLQLKTFADSGGQIGVRWAGENLQMYWNYGQNPEFFFFEIWNSWFFKIFPKIISVLERKCWKIKTLFRKIFFFDYPIFLFFYSRILLFSTNFPLECKFLKPNSYRFFFNSFIFKPCNAYHFESEPCYQINTQRIFLNFSRIV